MSRKPTTKKAMRRERFFIPRDVHAHVRSEHYVRLSDAIQLESAEHFAPAGWLLGQTQTQILCVIQSHDGAVATGAASMREGKSINVTREAARHNALRQLATILGLQGKAA